MKPITPFSNIRVASEPTFIPDETGNSNKDKCLVTFIKNHRRRGVDIRTEPVETVWWGEYARIAACQMAPGTCVNLQAEPRAYDKPTGHMRPGTNRPQQFRVTSWNVTDFEFSQGPSRKFMEGIVNGNIAKLKASGRMNPEDTVQASELLEYKRPTTVPFDITKAAQTGKYGFANIYIKSMSGMLKAGSPVPQLAAPAGVGGVNVEELDLDDDTRAAVQAALDKKNKDKAVSAGAGAETPTEESASEQPFETAS